MYNLSSTNFKVTTMFCKGYDKMSPMDNEIDFPQWLQSKMDEREWGQSDLAHKARINRQVIWGYLNRKRGKPDEDQLKAIAKALEIPVEEIYRAAGILPPEPEPDLLTKAIMYLVRDLENDEKNEILEYVKLRRRISKRSRNDN